eukprot:Em0002g241a
MLSFATCGNVPVLGGRGWYGGGGLVEVEGRVVWGGGGYGGGVYMLDEVRSKWSRVADGGEVVGTLAVCGGRLVWVGGEKDGVMSKEVKELRGGRWSHMPDMLVGCEMSCVLSVSGGGMVVMGGVGDGGRGGGWRDLNDVQVFDGGTQTWHRGPSLPEPCWSMSAVVHGDMVFVMGGGGMDRAVWCADIRDLQSIWRQLPDVPYYFSSVCVGDGVLLAIGGAEDWSGSKKTSSIYGLHGDDKKWKHVGDMPFACSRVDTLLLSDGGLLVVDGDTQQVLRITVQGLAKLFPITPTVRRPGKAKKKQMKVLCFVHVYWNNLRSKMTASTIMLYEEAMSKGYVETSVTKCLILGAAGVGKTHLKHLLLKKDPPEQRVSTGLADNPVRAISFSLAGVGGQAEDDWFVVEDDQALLRVVGGTIRDGGVSMATSLEEVVSSFPKMPIHVSSDGAGSVHPDPTPARVNVTMDTVQQSRTVSIEEELIHHINHSSDKKKLFGVKWIHFIDSGGQLQYHDILPLFIQKPAVAIFVLNLSEELSHQPTIEYYGADGKPDARPLIITVGTHRDAADRTVDRHVAKVLREEIISVCPQPIKMPIAWFGLEVLLQRSSHDGILSLVECQGCAKRLHIEGDAFSAALHHLVHNNVFLHYPEVLPQTVFCDPQVVLTKVSEIVEYHHKLLYRPDEGVAAKGDLVKFRDHGLLSVELLNKFSKHYTEGLFTVQDLLKLLVSVGAIAMVGDEGGVYLMPALLPHLDSGQVTKYCQPGTSLIIRPTQGCIPSGLFCCLVALLLSPINHSPWKVCMEGEKPLCLYRNCITFEIQHKTELVTLVDMFSYIVLHIDEMSSKLQLCRRRSGSVAFEDAREEICSEGQLMWFGESGVMKQDPSAAGTVPVTLDSEPSLQHLMEKVAAVIPSKCWAIGFQLGLATAELQAICPQHQGLENHHRAYGEIFDVWRRRGSPPYTWRTLTGVLRSASVDEVLLSEQLTSWITPCGSSNTNNTIQSDHVPHVTLDHDSTGTTLLNLDPRDADHQPSTLQPTQSFLETAGVYTDGEQMLCVVLARGHQELL